MMIDYIGSKIKKEWKFELKTNEKNLIKNKFFKPKKSVKGIMNGLKKHSKIENYIKNLTKTKMTNLTEIETANLLNYLTKSSEPILFTKILKKLFMSRKPGDEILKSLFELKNDQISRIVEIAIFLLSNCEDNIFGNKTKNIIAWNNMILTYLIKKNDKTLIKSFSKIKKNIKFRIKLAEDGLKILNLIDFLAKTKFQKNISVSRYSLVEISRSNKFKFSSKNLD
ncbi:hypothetical protein MHBO_002017 [Bonamia ostreae]|uniref:Uncharacterized protein n=1 Tax=Bonamia ostreae TaxID=126728 RepID=A0ABV2AKW6_9EUKA